MSLKNLIVKGRYFQHSSEGSNIDKQIDHLNKIKELLEHFLISSGYDNITPIIHNYATMEFFIHTPPPSEGNQKELLSFLPWKKKIPKNYYLERLGKTKEAVAWHINIVIYPSRIYEKNGVIVEITSEPAIIHMYQSLHYRPSLTQDDIDLIIYENTEFISRLANGVFLNELEAPKPLGSFVKTEVTVKLRAFGFEKIAELLEKGRKEIEEGKTENGLVDLRSAIELFFVKILEIKGEKPAPQTDVKKNIDKLQGLGYIDEYTQQLLSKLCYNGLYTTVSQVTHDRIPRDYFDTRFQYNIAEQSFDYVLERVIKLNLILASQKKE